MDQPIVKGKINSDAFDMQNLSTDKLSQMRRWAINNDKYGSAVTHLAYMLAKNNDPGGRVTDKDFDAAVNMLGSGGDKASLAATLEQVQQHATMIYNTKTETLNARDGKNRPLIDVDKFLKRDVKKKAAVSSNTEAITNNILKDFDL